jgi:uncharacterized protein with GYD domain
MPHFVCLFDWTDQGSKTVTDTVDRVDSASEMAQSKYGVHLEHIYWTVGAHDLVGVLEAPDVESLSAFLLELAKAGTSAAPRCGRSTGMR